MRVHILLMDELITDSPESAFERASLPAEIEDKLFVVNWNKRDVWLVHFVAESILTSVLLQRDTVSL